MEWQVRLLAPVLAAPGGARCCAGCRLLTGHYGLAAAGRRGCVAALARRDVLSWPDCGVVAVTPVEHCCPADRAAPEIRCLGSRVLGVTCPLRAGIDAQFSIGLDGLEPVAVRAVRAAVGPLRCSSAGKRSSSGRRLFYAMLLLLECGCLGVFAARDIMLFYVFFEFTLIPLFFLIGIWGSEERRYAAVKFFLFTLAGSVLTFLGLLAIVLWTSQSGAGELTFSIPELTRSLTGPSASPLPGSCGFFAALFAGFAIKVPLFPLAHLAAAGPRPGADGGQRDSGRRPAEDRHLRLLCDSACRCCRRPRQSCVPSSVVAGRGGHHLRGPGRVGSDATSSG